MNESLDEFINKNYVNKRGYLQPKGYTTLLNTIGTATSAGFGITDSLIPTAMSTLI